VTAGGVSCADERVCVVTSGGFQCFGGAACTLTSAGLTCPPDVPVCVVVNGVLTCSQGCVITSAGATCMPTGGVLDQPPVVNQPPGKPRRTPTPAPSPRLERRTAGSAPGQLPFTGAPAMPAIAAGWLLLAGGLVLRRRTPPPGDGRDG
jgi:hypothetical protein